MDSGLALRLGDERDGAAFFEIADRAEAPALVGRGARNREYAETFGRLLARPLDLITEQRHRPVGKPVEQRGTFRIVDPGGVGVHFLLQLAPVADRSANIGEDRAQLVGKFTAAAGIGAVELDVHHRLAPVRSVA